MPAQPAPQSSQHTRVTVTVPVGVFMAMLGLFIVAIAFPATA